MQIFPAIDLKDGQVVRLSEGDYDRVNIYSKEPAEIARQFIKQGAKNLHIVDLNGAKDGKPVNFDAIESIVKQGGLFTEVGGGIRDMDKIEKYLSLGVNRVILGTVAVKNYDFVKQAVAKCGEKIAVGVDTKDSMIAVNGWLETTQIDGVEFCKRLRDDGVKTVIYTDISKDGMLNGTNLEVYKTLSQIKGLDVVASGGISFEDEIKQLVKMNIYGAIVGKAIYEKMLDLKRVITLAEDTEWLQNE